MFWHNFKYQLKIILRDRALVFWTLAFPLIMATFFCLAFSNIESGETLQTINVAVVDDSAWQESRILRDAFAKLSQPDTEEQLFAATYVADVDAAKQLLHEEAVDGVLHVTQSRPEILALKSSVNVTALKSVVDQISEQAQVAQDFVAENPEFLANLAKAERANLKDISKENLSYTMIEYYSLIAMTCLYGGILSMVAINYLLANMSASGKRIAVSAVPKSQLLSSGLLGSYLVQLVGLGLLFAYTILVLHVDYGSNVGLVILLALIGSLAGTALGAMLASAFRVNENAKTGLIIAVTMFGCFLAGMMGITMKYVVDTNLPILNQINPANLITDGLYSLYYYGADERFWRSVLSLGVITLIMAGVSIFSLRKEQYDNL